MSLHPAHLADLRKSGLADDTIALMECESVRPCEIKGLKGVISAYRIPYFNLDGSRTGFERWKLFPPKVTDGGTMKYWQRAGTEPQLYLSPLIPWRALAENVSQDIIICEGEKKAASAAQRGVHALGIGGVWCWRVRDAFGAPRLLPMFDAFVWAGRHVILIPDSDAWRPDKQDVFLGIYALGQELKARGAAIGFGKLRDINGQKVGYDDWIVMREQEGMSCPDTSLK